jgi:hypothetical protein
VKDIAIRGINSKLQAETSMRKYLLVWVI